MAEFHVHCQTTLETNENFWKSIKILITKSHTVNKRLAANISLGLFQIIETQSVNKLDKMLNVINGIEELSIDYIVKKLEISEINVKPIETGKFNEIFDNASSSASELNSSNCQLIIFNKLLPKNLKQHSIHFELVYIDFRNNCVIFLPFNRTGEDITNISPYQLKLVDHTLSLSTLSSVDENFLNWLQNALFKKLTKWCENDQTFHNNENNNGKCTQSLIYVDIESYNQLYNELKEKYGTNMVKIWPERTDPSKFVFEDIAIATYLLLLWTNEREKLNSTKKQSFVDLGCGNGLLVYILSSEGHDGFGIDIRKRGIWDLYPETTVLKTETIIPSDEYIFPTTDWIIGNHSDELSPWIPVIAARSSYHTKYFLLPCCAYEFDGSKFQRRNCHQSQYNDFLDYISEISEICGFETLVDRLKIPSTKRVCIIGQSRKWTVDETTDRYEQIQQFIHFRCKKVNESQTDSKTWNDTFKPRANIEKVQNCTKIDKTISEDIIKIIFAHLIGKKRYLNEEMYPKWNIGGMAMLSDLAKLIPKDKLRVLKSECGGLQTLLKNNHQIFLVQNAVVQLRPPISLDERRRTDETGKKFIFKEKDCWLLRNHPDGCPLNDNQCTFKH